MANNTNPTSIPQPELLIFDGEGYDRWSLKLKTLFRSQDLWELMDKGILEDEEEARLKETKKKDAKALFISQQSLHPTLFSRIVAANTA